MKISGIGALAALISCAAAAILQNGQLRITGVFELKNILTTVDETSLSNRLSKHNYQSKPLYFQDLSSKCASTILQGEMGLKVHILVVVRLPEHQSHFILIFLEHLA